MTVVLPPGALQNALPLYQCMVVYMDNLLIYSPTLEQHAKEADKVLAILGERKLFTKAPTCEFGQQKLGFLGYWVPAEGIKVDTGHSRVAGARLVRRGLAVLLACKLLLVLCANVLPP